MELKRHLDPKIVFIGLYALLILVYIIIGLQPVDAVQYDVTGEINIPSLNLRSEVTKLELEHGELKTPDTIVGSYSSNINKTLLIGHSTTVFQDLYQLKPEDKIYYNRNRYKITSIQTVKKEAIKMSELMAGEKKNTIVIMTCAGELLENSDATHRLIITAVSE